MMNDNMDDRDFMYGYVAGKTEDDPGKKNFSWALTLLMLFLFRAGPAPKIENIDDFKKAIREFSDSIQAMELPEPEAFGDED